MWLCTKTTDRFKLVFQGDPAISGDGEDWIPLDQASTEEGKDPDVFVCRPLNSDECFRIIQATRKDQTFLSFASMLGVVEIHTGKRVVDDSTEIQAILENAQNMGPILSLSAAIFQVSREGLDSMTFRGSRSSVE